MQGSTYSGGVGFANTTWSGFGGREFASNAGQASREEQIVVAERVYARYGLSGWGCKALRVAFRRIVARAARPPCR